MSDYVYRMNLDAVLTAPHPDEDKRFRGLAALISRRLQSISTDLERRGLFFEASAADSLGMKFDDFSDGAGGCLDFSRFWDELCDWAETIVTSGRRDKSLCTLPNLPQEFSC